MDSEVIGKADSDEEMILKLDVPDDTLERAAGAEQTALTWIPCTHSRLRLLTAHL
jgi:hypothetical protein